MASRAIGSRVRFSRVPWSSDALGARATRSRSRGSNHVETRPRERRGLPVAAFGLTQTNEPPRPDAPEYHALMFYRIFGMLEPSPSQWTVIIWLIIVLAFAAAIVTPDPKMRILCLVIGIGTLVRRVAYNRFVD